MRAELIAVSRRLIELGVNQGTSGNISVRDGERFLITPSGIAYEAMTSEQIALVDFDGRYWGPCKPTTEWRIHRDVLRARPAANVVIHTHSMYATVLACLRREIPALHYYVAAAGGPTIRCAEYATYGTPELARNVIAALEDREACLLANHGLVVVGTTLDATLRRTFDVETLARQYVYALQIGAPVILGDDEIERVRQKLQTYGTQTADDAELRLQAATPP